MRSSGPPLDESNYRASYYDLDVADSEAAVPHRPRAARATLPQGIHRHSEAWANNLAKIRWSNRITEERKEALAHCDGIILTPLRAGDMADKSVFSDGQTLESSWTHANTFQPFGLMKGAFAEIGKGARRHKGQQGIDGTRRGQEMLETCAGFFDRVDREKSAFSRWT